MRKIVFVCVVVVMMGASGCGLTTRNNYATSVTTVEDVQARWGICKSIESMPDGSEKWSYPFDSGETTAQFFRVKDGRIIDAWAE